MAWKRRLKPKFNAIAAVKTVETLHEAFVANRQGYRQQLWSILQTSQELIFKLRDNEKVQRRFLRKLADIEDRGAPEGDVNLALEVMTAITGDSRSGRKRASKYGVVLNILADKGVPPGKTAEFIKAHGGIEKILRDNKPASQARARAVAHFAKDADVRIPIQARHLHNDGEVRCTIYMRMSDRDRILALPVGAGLKLDVLRIAQPTADLKLRRVAEWPSSNSDDDEDDEG